MEKDIKVYVWVAWESSRGRMAVTRMTMMMMMANEDTPQRSKPEIVKLEKFCDTESIFRKALFSAPGSASSPSPSFSGASTTTW